MRTTALLKPTPAEGVQPVGDSHHLRVLKDANLVTDYAVGNRRLYRLPP